EAPASTVKAEAPASTVKAEVPASTVKAEVPASTVKAEAPASTVKAEVPASTVKAEAPASTVKAEDGNQNNIQQKSDRIYTSVPEFAQISQEKETGDVSIQLYDTNKNFYSNGSIVTVSGGTFNNKVYNIENGRFLIENSLLGWPQTVTITVTENDKKTSPIYIINLPANKSKYSNVKTPDIGNIEVTNNNGRSLILHPKTSDNQEYSVGSAVFSDGVLLGYLNNNHEVRITEYTLPIKEKTEITIQDLNDTEDKKMYIASNPQTLDLSPYKFDKKTFNITLKSDKQSVNIIDTNGAVYYNRIWLPTTEVTIGDKTFSYVNHDGSGVSSFLSLFNSEGKLKNFKNVQYDGYDFTDGVLTQYWNSELDNKNSELDSQSFNFIISEFFNDDQLEYTVGLENISKKPIDDIILGFDLDISYEGNHVPVYKGNNDTLYVKGDNNKYGLYISKGAYAQNLGAINWKEFGTDSFQEKLEESLQAIKTYNVGSEVLSANQKPSIVVESSNFPNLQPNDKKLMQFQMELLSLPEYSKTPETEQPENGKTPETEQPENGKTPETEQPENGKTPETGQPENGKTPETGQPENGKTPETGQPENG
ncbi:hypothetical protein, partial [Enterococcus faecium]|uniref:hypothetical protein n=1 Tax=Enterococcus faecium TaxID=1352 RepID=UPI000A3FFAE8